MFEGQIRPKTGCPTMFPTEMEADFALYMKHCCLLRVPRTRTLMKEDVLHYVQYKNLKIKNLADEGPGKSLGGGFPRPNKYKPAICFSI